jgi:hypothetical protein
MTVESSIVEEKSARYNFIKNFYLEVEKLLKFLFQRTKRSMLHTRWAHPPPHYCISGRYNDTIVILKLKEICAHRILISVCLHSQGHIWSIYHVCKTVECCSNLN